MKKILVMLMSISLLACAQNPNEKIDKYLKTLTENDRYMGSVVGLKDGKVLYEGYHGYSNLDTQEKNTIDNSSTFRIGSISKTFTAVMIFQLIDEGKLKITDSVAKFFPNLKRKSSITIAHLLNHSSGFINFTIEEHSVWLSNTLELSDVIDKINQYELSFEPGSQTEYNNTNYYLLGHIISKADESTYAESLKKRISDPIGLSNTYFPKRNERMRNECISYSYSENKWREQSPMIITNAGGAGGIISTAKDVGVFINALFKQKLISEKSLNKMLENKTQGFGSGIKISELNNMPIYMHEGAVDGFQSLYAYSPTHKITMVLLSNGLSFNKSKILMDTFGCLLDNTIEIPKFAPVSLSDNELSRLAGIYETKYAPFDLTFEIRKENLYGAPSGSKLEELKPLKKYKFEYGSSGIYLDFDIEKKTVLFTMNDNPPILFQKK